MQFYKLSLNTRLSTSEQFSFYYNSIIAGIETKFLMRHVNISYIQVFLTLMEDQFYPIQSKFLFFILKKKINLSKLNIFSFSFTIANTYPVINFSY